MCYNSLKIDKERSRQMSTKRTIAATLTLGLAVLATGCIDEARVFYIRQNQVPSTGCQVATATTVYNPMGQLDVAVGMGYMLYPLLENALTSSASGDGEPERNALTLKGFDVEIDLQGMENAGGMGSVDADKLKFWVPASGYLPPGGKLAGIIKVIPDWLADIMSRGPIKPQKPPGGWPVVYVIVTAVAAKTGSEVESSTFVYPIEICNECLVDKRKVCPDTDKDKTVLANYCGLPQDSAITCCPLKKAYSCFTAN